MIAFLRGTVQSVEEDSIVVLTGSIGFSVLVPMSRLHPYPAVGQEIALHTHLQIREDAWVLFGFAEAKELQMFRQLQSVSGVGAKTALAIVDKLEPAHFAAVVAAQDVKPLTNVSGVGKKTAERILLELKDKVKAEEGGWSGGEAAVTEETLSPDLLAALKQLGYSAMESRAFALAAQSALGPDATPEQLLRKALATAMKS